MNTAELAPVSATEARELTDRIKVAVDGTWHLIKQAYLSRAWDALGYTSWDDYCTREFGTSRLRLPREERQEVVSSMREIGMSTRAIAAATGTSVGTVHAELNAPGVQNRTPEPVDFYEDDEQVEDVQEAFVNGEQRSTHNPERVTGTDGKSYAAQPARTPNRSALPPMFRSIAADLTKLTTRLEKLRQDDRYKANRTSIADHCVPELRRASDVLLDLLDDLSEDN
jgi:hypothetical protein